MASYVVPATAEERIKAFNDLVDEFKVEYVDLTEKQKKVAAYRSRKALLSIAKLTRFLRKDIQDIAETMSRKKGKEEKVVEASVVDGVVTAKVEE